MTTLIYSKHMLFYFPLQIIIFWLQSFDKSLKPNFCASWPRSCVVPLFTDSPVCQQRVVGLKWCKTRQSEDKTPKTGEAQMWTFWNEFWGPKSDRCWWMVVNDCKIWVVSPWHQISFCLEPHVASGCRWSRKDQIEEPGLDSERKTFSENKMIADDRIMRIDYLESRRLRYY